MLRRCVVVVVAISTTAVALGCTSADPRTDAGSAQATPTLTPASTPTPSSATPPSNPATPSDRWTPTPPPAGMGYRNPVFDHDAPDPTVIRAPDGSFYAYTTQSEHDGRLVHLPVLRSSDMVRWELLGEGLPELPRWAGSAADTWAPHVQRLGGRYVLFISVRDGLTGLMQIATAVASTPAGPFRPVGGRLLGRRDETIDPKVLDLHGRRYLYWSQENTVRVARLRAGGLEVARPRPVVLEPVGVEGSGYRSVVEGAWVVPHGRFVYLFTSGDRCCGADAHYAVSVARSRHPLGPFSRRRGGPTLEASGGVVAPGHCSVIRLAGRDWMVFHAMVSGSEDRVLMIDPITWRRGWPHVRTGSPSTTRVRAPRIR